MQLHRQQLTGKPQKDFFRAESCWLRFDGSKQNGKRSLKVNF